MICILYFVITQIFYLPLRLEPRTLQSVAQDVLFGLIQTYSNGHNLSHTQLKTKKKIYDVLLT